ncbi:hypothetical protein PAXRUDRAFT_715684 [Paxillus rubicundulus Ve08.2h10]|uniref:Uncharacterized protein n=1 Tax=Paxillus rubicundulus Ve08.2h10 TaxID=930991 RepID=A0A0D0DL16_9AGAM|nr:hypothetical protein PAXRUDRAFT_715684 [Paxillus rubicundulus Ve08.2h10]
MRGDAVNSSRSRCHCFRRSRTKSLQEGWCLTAARLKAYYCLQRQQVMPRPLYTVPLSVWAVGKHVAKQRRCRIGRYFSRPHVLQCREQYDVLPPNKISNSRYYFEAGFDVGVCWNTCFRTHCHLE